MIDNVYAGRSIVMPKPGRHQREHLWIVVTDPIGDPPTVIIVNLTTARLGSDRTVVLHTGDHPFIKHETVVNYADAREAPANKIAQLLDFPGYAHSDCEPGVLALIQDGVIESPFTPNNIREICEDLFG